MTGARAKLEGGRCLDLRQYAPGRRSENGYSVAERRLTVSRLRHLSRFGQSVWIDFIRRNLLTRLVKSDHLPHVHPIDVVRGKHRDVIGPEAVEKAHLARPCRRSVTCGQKADTR
jgi:hypothetical protein